MKYVGIYWSLFAPMIKKSIRQRFSASLAEQSIRATNQEERFLEELSAKIDHHEKMLVSLTR